MLVPVPGARLWCEDSGGGGVPVVFLHAGGGSSAMWIYQAAVFAEAGFRFVAYDRRGYGKTESDAADVPASEDLARLADALKLERFHLVATAAGGIVAFDYALSYPQRLSSLVVANSIGGAQDEDYLALQRRLRPSPQFDALPADVRELGPAYRAANPEGASQWVALEHAAQHKGAARLPPTRNRLTFARLAGLRVPTLLLTGDADLYAPPPVLERYRKAIPGATSVVIPGCGHSAYWETPGRFNQEVLDFIRKN